MRTILVIANQTIGGAKLFETVQAKTAGGEARVVMCVPRVPPHHGNIIYDDAVFEAAQVRVDLARSFLRDAGIDAIGEVGDPDPYTATMDAIGEHHPDEVIVSTLPATSSGWLRRDLIERIADASGLPVEHVVVDLAAEGLPFKVTLVVANRTAATDDLLDCLKEKAASSGQADGDVDGPGRLFIACVPQEGGDGSAARMARARLAQVLDRLRSADLVAAGIVGDPDPYTAVKNALEFFRVDDIVISTLPATRSGWLRGDLIRRVETATNLPVTHVEVQPSAAPARAEAAGSAMEAASIPAVGTAHDEHHHGPPEANRSSRVDPQMLGMLLFIISEIMVFGAFFTAYFFIRVVHDQPWPANGTELPKLVAGVNTAILLSSSLTLHWAQTSAKNGNRFGLKAGMLTTTLLGATFLFVQINEYVHIGFAPHDSAQGSVFYGLTGLHGAHVAIGLSLLIMVTVRAFRGHFSPEEHRGVEIPGIYWHFVDVMWIVVYTTIYVL
jgi:cytochrome c oxidase subunit 3